MKSHIWICLYFSFGKQSLKFCHLMKTCSHFLFCQIRHITVSVSATGKTPSQRCYCACPTLTPVFNKKTFLEDLLASLAVNKTQLSSYRRKYVSASDDCPISAGLGYLGITILVFNFALIVLCDITRILSTDHKNMV